MGFFFGLITIILITQFNSSDYYDYSESYWGDTCKLGQRNSPIDFPTISTGAYTYTDNYIQILSSNYTTITNEYWQFYHDKKFLLNVTNYPGTLIVRKNGIIYRYDLIDVHLHLKGEHLIQGQAGDIEIHLVHSKNKNYIATQGVLADPDSENIYLVVGIIFKASGSVINEDIQKSKIGTLQPVDSLDMNHYIKNIKYFYHYLGGLTTPNCDEVVNWVVIDNIEFMTKDQFDPIDKWVRGFYPNGNARSPRPINNRTLYYVTNSILTANTSSIVNFTIENWKIIISAVIPIAVMIIIIIIFLIRRYSNKAKMKGELVNDKSHVGDEQSNLEKSNHVSAFKVQNIEAQTIKIR